MVPNLPVAASEAAASPPPPPAFERPVKPARTTPKQPEPPRAAPAPTLDSTWDRKLARGTLQPDLTLDLHGHTLDTAYTRLMDGIDQARAMGARTVLLVTGKSRPVAAADRAGARGAIRAKVLDWLAASRHHVAIAAVRKAHIRHGGEGALYIVLRRPR
jgi:DNA-nicking Smr family endonuclease